MTELWPTAIHEAGHAVIIRDVGISIKRIVIGHNLRRNRDGYVQLYHGRNRRDIITCLAMAMSGKIAENLVLRTKQTTNGPDRDAINRCLNGFSTAVRKHFMRCAARHARRVLKRERIALVYLAAYLEKHGRVKGTARIDRIMKREKQK